MAAEFQSLRARQGTVLTEAAMTATRSRLPTVSEILDSVLGTPPRLVTWKVRQAVRTAYALCDRPLDAVLQAVMSPDPAMLAERKERTERALALLEHGGHRILGRELPLVRRSGPVPYAGRADALALVRWPDEPRPVATLIEVKARDRLAVYERDILQVAAYLLAAQERTEPPDEAALLMVTGDAVWLLGLPPEMLQTAMLAWAAVLVTYAGCRSLHGQAGELLRSMGDENGCA
jgi:hypothetical protein